MRVWWAAIELLSLVEIWMGVVWRARGWVGLLAATLLLPAVLHADELSGIAREARKAAARARAEGKTKEAVEHLLVCLGEHPHSPLVLTELIETCAQDAGARALWSHALVAAIAYEKGRFKLPKGRAELLDKADASLLDVAEARASAVAGLARSAGRLRGVGSYVLARAYRDLARLLTIDAPALWQAHGAAFEKAAAKARPSAKAVVQALRRSAGSLEGPDPAGGRLELGRALRGLATQARGKAAGAPSGIASSLDSFADGIIREALAQLQAVQMAPLTIEQLRAMDEKAIRAFNRKHANIRRPGRALSTSGRYMIVSPCGHDTLLKAAEVADPTHERLARWFGVDPFAKKGARGEIRVFSTFADLECESAPYFWAPGFQRGAVTVLRVAAERKIDLARMLSHELNHRFDGLLHPGFPGWLAEGRSVWAEGAFAASTGGDFIDNYVDGGQISDASPALYGVAHWLEKFLQGEVDDYRENYSAGHALWVYLSTWEEKGRRVFHPQLGSYLQSAGTGTKSPVDLFKRHFADGKDGRPKAMDAFASGFGEFLSGWYTAEDPAWFRRYTHYAGDDRTSPYLEDVATWSLERKREEPVFGQDHPARAAAVLAEAGQVRPAIGLLEWSLAVDDHDEVRARLLARLLEGDGRVEAAAAMRIRLGGPQISFLPKKHAVREYARSLARAAADYAARGLDYPAYAFLRRLRRLEERIGGHEPRAGGERGGPTSPHHSVCGPNVRLAERTWVEERLSGDYDKWRREKAWRMTTEGDLIVGFVARNATGASTRAAGSPFTFVRSDRRLDGSYTLSGRVTLLSPHCEGAIVLGWTRRDRNVRLMFEAGEWAQEDRSFAPGEDLRAVTWRITGLRYRDRALSRAEPVPKTNMTKTKNSFSYRIDVAGDTLSLFVDGRNVATFADGAGRPIAGYTGFALARGAIRVEQPRVRFHQTAARAPCPHGVPVVHDPAAPMRSFDNDCLGQRMPGIPRSERGTLLLWYPLPYLEDDATDVEDTLSDVRMQMNAAAGACRRIGCAPRFAVYLPKRWPSATREKFAALARELFGDDVFVHAHAEGLGAAAGVDPDEYGYRPYFLFLDPHGVVRVRSGTIDAKNDRFVRWMRIFRD